MAADGSSPPPPQETSGSSSARTATRIAIPAWLMSLVTHATVLIVLAATFRFAPPTNKQDEVPVGIVLVQRTPAGREYFTGSEKQQTTAATSPQQANRPAATVLPSSAEMPLDLSGLLPATGESTGMGDIAGGLPDAGDLAGGPGGGQGIPQGVAQTEVFGLKAQGSKFVYVFDRSGSMAGFGGRPIKAAKRELLESLQDLDRIHQFQIIFYNQQPQVFAPPGRPPQLLFGDDRGKGEAGDFVRSIVASGNTDHMLALTMALRMSPDVIFFLTDANEPQLTEEELASVRRMNSAGTKIYAIEFGAGPPREGDNFLRRLAAQNDGASGYVNIYELPD